ncbi:hypothetical protein C6503_19145 [Candidatus Poribacteria bacterium]|nr:MAG: hypothetical protein C6503_19145 [Candidatus Poribacteria bacterium]
MREHLNHILELLNSGEKRSREIFEAVNVSEGTARKYLKILQEENKVVSPQKGLYDLHEDYRPLTPLENRKIVKDLIHFQRDTLIIHRRDLDFLLTQPDPDPDEKQRLLDCIKTLALSIDRLLKRWNLLTQGYDANTRQAVEDAKHKTVEREKQNLENAPPEDQRTEVGHFHSELKVLWDNLPESEKKSKTV